MVDIQQIEDWVRAGRHAEAMNAVELKLQSDPADARALVVRFNAANAVGRLDIVIDSLQRLLQQFPLHAQFSRLLATAVNNRGGNARLHDSATAAADFRAAIDLWPAHPQAWFNLGLCLRDLGQRDAAAAAFLRHIELNPGDPAAHLLYAGVQAPDAAAKFLDGLDATARTSFDAGWMAQTAARAGQVPAVLAALDRLHAGHDLAAATEAVTELRLRGEAEAASRGAAQIVAASIGSGSTTLRAEMIAALALPAIYADAEDVRQWRRRFNRGLDRLEEGWSDARLAKLDVPLRQLAHSNFFLAYQGQNDLEPQTRFASLIERAAAALQPELCEPLSLHRSGRIGLLSSSWRTCTVGSYFGGWIGWLREAGFEVFLYQLGPQRDAHTDRLGAAASVFRYLEQSIEDVARTVRADDLDLLIYPEVGMDARLTPLAALRLARQQAVAWGHPVTSGFSSIEHFLSCASMEPHDAGAHYRERLHILPGLGVDYRRPTLPEQLTPDALGLDALRPRLLVPQSIFKLHPDGDAVLAGIAQQVPQVQFVLFAPEFPRWMDQYRERLALAFTRAGRCVDEHLVVQPLGTRERFLQVNLACDLMLDSLYWSGGNTAIDALLTGLPVVACPGATMRGRQSLAMLAQLDLDDELVVASPEAQVARVVELLGDVERRHDVSQRVRARLPALFDSEPARQSLVEWARRVVAA